MDDTKKESGSHDFEILDAKVIKFLRAAKRYKTPPASLVSIDNIQSGGKEKRWERMESVARLFFVFNYAGYQKFHHFTVLFSYNFARRAEASGNVADFVRRRINPNIRHALGHIPPYAFIIERSDKGDLHMHGIMKIDPKDSDKIKSALKRTTFGPNHKKMPINRFIVRHDHLKTVERWLAYCLKQQQKTGQMPQFYCPNELTTKARGMYEAYIGQKTLRVKSILQVGNDYIFPNPRFSQG